MYSGRSRLFFITGLVLIASCRTASEPARSDSDALAARRAAFVATFNSGDVPALTKFYLPEAVLVTFNGQAVKTAEVIAAGLARASSRFDLEHEPMQGRSSGSLSYEVGAWRHFDKGTRNLRDTGIYAWVWRQTESGTWMIELHSVTRRPPSAPQ